VNDHDAPAQNTYYTLNLKVDGDNSNNRQEIKEKLEFRKHWDT
jgi:hypothetical protein